MSRSTELPSLAVVGTDTDAGKTTFAALLLHAAAHERGWDGSWRYWKPVQSGPPDTELIRARCPDAKIHEAVYSYAHPAAPDVAARVDRAEEPRLAALREARPKDRPLLVETVGGPLSPIAKDTLQIEWLVDLGLPTVLVAPNRVGTIHNVLGTLLALRQHGIACRAVILMGPACEDNVASIVRHGGVAVLALAWPDADTPDAYAERAKDVLPFLHRLAPEPEPVAPALRDIDAQLLWHPYTPLLGERDRSVCVRAEREFLHLDTGEVLIDAISSWWTCIHGHVAPRLRAALVKASRNHDQVIFAGLSHEPGIRLAQELLATLPESFARVFYSDNGSTAVEAALKIVHGWWRRRDEGSSGRDRFVCFENAYHGDTFGAMSVGRDPLFTSEYEGLLFDAIRIPCTEEAMATVLAEHGERLAGVIVEPLIQAAGGMHMTPAETLRDVCVRARDAGLPVIFDEVMTGFGRTGTMFAFEQIDDFVPDVLCLAKGLSGGVLPLAATVASSRITEPWLDRDRARMLFHGHSYTANPLACATGRASLELFRTGRPLEDARRIEAFWRAEFADEDVRVCGTVIAADIGSGGGYLAAGRDGIIRTAREHGVFLRPLGDVVYAMPPYCTSDDSLRTIARALRAVFQSVR